MAEKLYKRTKKSDQEYEDYLDTMRKKGKKVHKMAVTEYEWKQMNRADKRMAKMNAEIH